MECGWLEYELSCHCAGNRLKTMVLKEMLVRVDFNAICHTMVFNGDGLKRSCHVQNGG